MYKFFKQQNKKQKMKVEQSPQKHIEQTIIKKCVQLSQSFRNLRINHKLLVLVLIWSRVFFGTSFNILKITDVRNKIYILVSQYSQLIAHEIISTRYEIFHITFLSFLVIMSVCSIIFIVIKSTDFQKISIMFILTTSMFNCLLSRYLIKILITQQQFDNKGFLKVITIVCFVLLVFFQLCFCIISSSCKANNQNFLICQKSLVIFIKQFLTYCLVIVAETTNLGSQQRFKIIIVFLNILHLILSQATLYKIIKQFVYHNSFTELVYLLATCFESSLCLVSLVSVITQAQLFVLNMDLVIFALTFFLFLGSRQYIYHRNHLIILNPSYKISQIKIFLHILSCSLRHSSSNTQLYDFLINMLKNQHIQICKTLNCICKEKKSIQDETYQQFLIKAKIDQFFNYSNQNFEVTLLCCYIKLDFFHAFPDLLNKLYYFRRKQGFSFTSKIEYQSFKLQVKNYLDRKKKQTNAVQTQKIQKQDTIIIQFTNLLKKIIATKSQFWSRLAKKIPDLSNLQKPIKRHYFQLILIQKMLGEIYQSFLSSRTILDLVVIYEIFVQLKTNLPSYLKQALKNSQTIQLQNNKIFKQKQFRFNLIMFQSKVVTFQSKIEQKNMGIILNVSKNIKQVFGYNCETIIGLNINQIMPKSMQKQHDVILQSWRERATWSNVHKIRFIYAMSKDHTCFSSAIYLRLVQRNESINILATFVKANQFDYMIVNEEGIIEGVGTNIKKIFGEQVAKIPFSFICSKASQIINETKREMKKRTKVLQFFHVKGLQQLISSYHQKKNQILANSESDLLTSTVAKCRQRSTKIMVTYQPYKMGRVFYVVFKYLSDKQVNMLKQKEQNNTFGHQQGKQMENQIKIEKQTTKNDKQGQGRFVKISTQKEFQDLQHSESEDSFERDSFKKGQFKQSIKTSNHQTQVSSQNIFNQLQQKIKGKSDSLNNKIFLYLVVILLILLVLSVLLIAQQVVQLKVTSNYQSLINESLLFYQKFNSLVLIYGRFLNLKQLSSDYQTFYNLNRITKELTKTQQIFKKQNRSLWMNSKLNKDQNKLGLTRVMNWSKQNGQVIQIIVQQFFQLFVQIYKQSKLAFLKIISSDMIQNQSILKIKDIGRNIISFQKFINTNLLKIKIQIISHLNQNIILSRVIFSVCLFVFSFGSVLMWKLRKVQKLHFNSIITIFLSISDQNCENCLNYFTKASRVLNNCLAEMIRNQNKPLYIQYQLIKKDPLSSILEKFQVQKDKIRKTKLIMNTRKKYSLYIWSFIVVLLFFIGTGVKWNFQQGTYKNKNQYINSFYEFQNINQREVYHFILIKQITDTSTIKDRKIKLINDLINEISIQNQKNQNFQDKFLSLMEISKIIDPESTKNIQQYQSSYVCQKISSIDPQFYQQICQGDKQFSYSSFKLFEIHSFISEQKSQISEFVLKNYTGTDLKDIRIVQEALDMQNLYTNQIVKTTSVSVGNYNRSRLEISRTIFILIVVVISFTVAFSIFYSKLTNKKIKQNLWSIVIIPQIIFKYTKNSMKTIQNLLYSQ